MSYPIFTLSALPLSLSLLAHKSVLGSVGFYPFNLTQLSKEDTTFSTFITCQFSCFYIFLTSSSPFNQLRRKNGNIQKKQKRKHF
mmetsp:Transcript_19483/g.22124  ORF Transcript_19483/g.22124 Transcript_19483/m.22124 type:complete len:85 (+) Transcript_19483:476-730(+)